MLKDLEGHEVQLAYIPNRHMILLGKSGYGKTYGANREAAHRIRDGDKIAILDVSGSYTKEELKRAGNVFGNHICYRRMNEDTVVFPVYSDNFSGTIIEALIEAFEITSYNQEKILSESCEEIVEDTGVFTFMDLFGKLKEHQSECQIGEDEGVPDMFKNTGYLLNKLRSVRNIDNITFVGHDGCGQKEKQVAPVTVFQLSDLPGTQRKRLSSFLLSLLWANARYRNNHKQMDGFDAVLIDEFQHFPLTEDSSFNAILREGRKCGFSAILCTQYLNDHGKTELSALTQAGTILLFRPTEKEVKLVLDLFDLEEFKKWKKILLGLNVGQAILVGSYKLDNGRELGKPIIVNIEDDDNGRTVQHEEAIVISAKTFLESGSGNEQGRRGRGTVIYRR